ncbi:MAG: GH32 C-terminal domain-containing protein [Puia sp.]
MDYGADDYAGVSFSNTGNEKIFLGWMSNWQYATRVPTVKWEKCYDDPACTALKKIGAAIFYNDDAGFDETSKHFCQSGNGNKIKLQMPYKNDFNIPDLHSFTSYMAIHWVKELRIGFDEEKNAFFIDRTKAGKSEFDPHFATIHYAPRIAKSKESDLTVILDNSSVELFADGGLTCMTDIFFPELPPAGWANRIQEKVILIGCNSPRSGPYGSCHRNNTLPINSLLLTFVSLLRVHLYWAKQETHDEARTDTRKRLRQYRLPMEDTFLQIAIREPES